MTSPVPPRARPSLSQVVSFIDAKTRSDRAWIREVAERRPRSIVRQALELLDAA